MQLSSECVRDLLQVVENAGDCSVYFPVDIPAEVKEKYDDYTLLNNFKLCRMNNYITIGIESNEGYSIEGLTDAGKEYLHSNQQ